MTSNPRCRYCHGEVYPGPGMMMVETKINGVYGAGFICHEECYQMSGDDEGYVERLNKLMEDFFDDEEPYIRV